MKPSSTSQRIIDDFQKAIEKDLRKEFEEKKSSKTHLLYKRKLEKHMAGLEASIMAHNSWHRAQALKSQRHARALRSEIEEQEAHLAILSRKD